MSLIRNQQFFNNFGINPLAASINTIASVATSSPATGISINNPNRRRNSNSNKSSLNRSYYMQSPSNNSSINSSCDSTSSNRASFIESDLLETNIKEIEFTLLGLMDNEAVANRNSQRLASISNGNLKNSDIYFCKFGHLFFCGADSFFSTHIFIWLSLFYSAQLIIFRQEKNSTN